MAVAARDGRTTAMIPNAVSGIPSRKNQNIMPDIIPQSENRHFTLFFYGEALIFMPEKTENLHLKPDLKTMRIWYNAAV